MEAHTSSYKVVTTSEISGTLLQRDKTELEKFCTGPGLSSWKMAKPTFEPRSVKSKITNSLDFLGSPVVMTLYFHGRECGFDPWFGNLRFHMSGSVTKPPLPQKAI